MRVKILNLIFLIGVLLCLVAGGIRTFWFPKEVNEYENRYANKVSAYSAESFAAQEFQNNLENALSDQIFGSSAMKKAYHAWTADYAARMMQGVLSEHKDRYFNILGSLVFGGDQLVYAPRELEEEKEKLQARADCYNALIQAYPDIEFYSYYIEKDSDIHFDTGEKIGASEYYHHLIDLPEKQKAVFLIDSYDQFREYFYRTDHHWNNRGSYEGYREILQLLGCKDEPLVPSEEVTITNSFAGSKTAYLKTPYFEEPFCVYPFDFPPMDITVNGIPREDYGAQAECIEHHPDGISYGGFYGGDEGEIILDTGRPERKNILIFGDSYDNAILKLIASHYNITYSIDFRHYERQMQTPFHLAEYLQTHHVDQILFIGNLDYFTMDVFALEN